MDVVDMVRRAGGLIEHRHLVGHCGRRRVQRALAEGDVVRAGTAVALPQVDAHRRRAREMSGVLSHLSAAQVWGLRVKWPPESAWVTLPRHRNAPRPGKEVVVYADLGVGDVVDGITTPLRTVVDCARRLPFDEALAVADNALRRGMVTDAELRSAARQLRGRGAPQARAVAAAANGLAENPFESVLRAIALGIPEMSVVAQGEVDLGDEVYRPDLVDRDLRLAIEADSHEFHTSKPAHDRDCERFTRLGIAGWLVLRFSWEQVMLRPSYVGWALAAAAKARARELA